ncbi:MAG: hypothetical protein ABIQ66_00025 [Novosphingobium sp.]
MAFAAVLRVALSILYPNVITPDELLQYKEQSYRIVTGQGVIPWEFHVGARTWLLPVLLVPIVYLTRLFSTAPADLSIAIAVVSSLISLLIIPAGYKIAHDVSGKPAARITAWILAIWGESVFFSSHFTADTLVAVPLIWAIAIARNSGESYASAVRFGALLGLTAMIRMQLAPILAIIAFLSLDIQVYRKQLVGMIAGALPVLALFGLIDWMTWGWPFFSYWLNFYANSKGVASFFGESPFGFYLQQARMNWSIMTPVVALTAVAGSIRAPKLALYTIVVSLVFSAVAHKEYRFIYPVLPILLTLCGIGTAQLVKFGSSRLQSSGNLAAAPALVVALLWGAGSAWSITRFGMDQNLHRYSNLLIAVESINADPRACGVVLMDNTWGVGRSGLRDDIGMFSRLDALGGPTRGKAAALPYNRILAMQSDLRFMQGSGFRQSARFDLADAGTVFIYARNTPCSSGGEQFLDQRWIDPKLDKLLAHLKIAFRW